MFTIIMGAIAAFAALGACFLLRRAIPEWWARRPVRLSGGFFVLLALVGLVGFVGGVQFESYSIYRFGKIAVATAFVTALPLLGALMVTALWLGFGRRRATRRSLDETAQAGSRRRFLQMGMVAPAAAVGLSATGLVAATMTPGVRELDVDIKGLDPRLEGFRILHVTDAHLGPFVGLDDFEDVVASLAEVPPDLIVVTGDLADFLRLVPPAMKILNELKPRCGVFASMGNHEYHHKPREVLKAFDRANVPLLVSHGTLLSFRDAPIYLAGADDADGGPGPEAEYLERSVTKALEDWPSDTMAVVMSHRPRGFDSAAKHRVPLTLAGHTHGYQMGLGGWSVGEVIGAPYPRGFYRQGESQLYTSTGFGHWFPFRLGCPREAPVITLRRRARESSES